MTALSKTFHFYSTCKQPGPFRPGDATTSRTVAALKLSALVRVANFIIHLRLASGPRAGLLP